MATSETLNRIEAVVGLSGRGRRVGGFAVSLDEILRIEVPEHFTPEGIERMRRDFEGGSRNSPRLPRNLHRPRRFRQGVRIMTTPRMSWSGG